MEVSSINRQKFLAELNKLLGFMSSWDREATIEKYNAMFDAADSETEVLVTLGSPTRLAITLANEYVPTPAPGREEALPAAEEQEEAPAEAGESAAEPVPDVVSAVEQALEQALAEEAPEPVAETAAAPEAAALFTDSPEQLSGKKKKRARRIRPLALALYIPLAVVVGLPVAVVLIALGVPFLLAGASLGAVTVWGAWQIIAALTMFSDVLLVIGAGLALLGVSLLLAWFGLWLSIALGCAWLGGVVFRLGGRLCGKKEVPEA